MPSPATRELFRHRLLLLALWLLFYASFSLFTPPLLDDADSVHAEVAREMLLRHDPVTLYANGIRYLEKAPLFYWLMAASMRLLGPSTAASRLPLALSVLALALLLEAFARRAFNPRTGLYAGLITLSSFGIFIFSRINIPDVLVCLLLTAALFLYFLSDSAPIPGTTGDPAPSLLLCTLFASALALNVLTKGLIGIVFPLGIVAAHLLLTLGWRGASARLRRLHLLPSLAVFLAIAVPWHILIALANPAHGHPAGLTHAGGHWHLPYPTDGNVHSWAWFYFLNEQLFRYLNLRIPHDYDTSPLPLFLGLIFVWLLPWSAFLPTALLRAARLLRHSPRLPGHHPSAAPFSHASSANLQPSPWTLRSLSPPARLNLLLLLWTSIPLAFFAFSTRQEYYVLPALPPMILLLARLLERASRWNSAPESAGVLPPSSPLHTASARLSSPHDELRHDELRHDELRHDEVWNDEFRNDELRDIARAGAASSRIAALLLLLGALTSFAILAFLLRTSAPAPHTDLATLLHSNPADYALSFGHFLDLTTPALALFRLPLALTAAATLLGPLAHLLLRRARRPHAATLSLAASAFLFLLAAHGGLVLFAPTLTSFQLAEGIRPRLHPADLLAIHGEYESASTLAFYLRRTDLHIVEGRSSNLWYGSFFPDAPPIFETPASLAARWPGPQRIFLWQDPHDPERPPLHLPAPVFVLITSGGKQILSNQP